MSQFHKDLAFPVIALQKAHQKPAAIKKEFSVVKTFFKINVLCCVLYH